MRVQRCIFIGSYCFTLFAFDFKTKTGQIADIENQLSKGGFSTTRLDNTQKPLLLSPEGFNTVTSLASHFIMNPEYYDLGESPLKNEFKGKDDDTLALLIIPLSDVLENDLGYALGTLFAAMISRDTVVKFRQKFDIVFDGWNDDPREVWEIPEIRRFVSSIDEEFPFSFFFFSPNSQFFQLLPLCLLDLEKKGDTHAVVPEQLKNFMRSHFEAQNELCYRYAISDETNSAITQQVFDWLSNQFLNSD